MQDIWCFLLDGKPLEIDEEMYKWRRLIEIFFCKLKEFKRIAMRRDQTDESFSAMIYVVAAIVTGRLNSKGASVLSLTFGSHSDFVSANRYGHEAI